jgi:hypothetical protein
MMYLSNVELEPNKIVKKKSRYASNERRIKKPNNPHDQASKPWPICQS